MIFTQIQSVQDPESQEVIRQVLPNAEFLDPCLHRLEGSEFAFDVSISAKDPCKGFRFHVHGGETSALIVAEIHDRLNLWSPRPHDR